MQYLLMIYRDESQAATMSDQDRGAMLAAYGAFTQEIKKEGIMLAGDALKPVATATTVRVRSGDVMHTDGPFAETKEQLGGYYLIEVPNLDDALKVAARLPGSWYGSVEVRPVMGHEDYAQ